MTVLSDGRMDAAAAGERLNLHPETILAYSRDGRIGFVRVGRRKWFTDQLIQAYLDANTVAAVSPTPAAPIATRPTRNPRRTYAT